MLRKETSMQAQTGRNTKTTGFDAAKSTDVMTDKKVGRHIRIARLAKSLSLRELSEQLGISLQQLQRYEAGSSRISVSALWKIAKELGHPVTYFYGAQDISCSDESDEIQKEFEQLFHAFHQIDKPHLRRAVIDLAAQLSKVHPSDQ